MERLRYFYGQLLTAQDFQAEQQYQNEKRWLHNRMLHGFGVVDGLAVSVDDGSGAGVVSVSPGFALDPYGREILVDCQEYVDLQACTSDACLVTIEFTETPTHPVPSPSGGVEFSRVSEGYAIRVAAEDAAESTNSPQLGLARLIRVEDNWIVDESYSRKTV